MASRLKDLLEFRLLKNFELCNCQFSEIRVQCQGFFEKKAPQDWKQRVHGAEIDMAHVGLHMGHFVIWGNLTEHGNRCYCQPYIILAGLASLTQLKALHAGVVTRIFKMLKLYVQNYDEFVNSDKFDELQNELEDILTGLK